MEDWKSYLSDATLNVLPADFVRSSDGKVVESSFSRKFSSASVKDLETLATHYKASAYEVGIALYMALIHRLTGDEDVVVGSAIQGDKLLHSISRYAQFNKSTTTSSIIEEVRKSESLATAHPVMHAEIASLFEGQEKFRTLFFEGTPSAFSHLSSRDLKIVLDTEASQIHVYYNSLLFRRQRIEFLVDEFEALVHGAAAVVNDPKNESEPSVVSGVSLVTDSQKTSDVIPDPAQDLDWSNFRGSIQDIFAENAAKFPERDCIVETANPYTKDSKARSFSYKQIDEASNVVAHYLIQNGIVVDDVVTIYAYRGVDLVISVMGVLKAGATFSVIDPAYPASRQNIYLSVSKPKGLVVLKKAGKLSPTVKEYIKDNLELKAELIDVELQDDGSVTAVEDLTQAAALKSKQTGVKVGPDNHPTLSFTSGSEGIPKGVRGRHFSLTYYFPWMSETFNITEKDRFTMLSGIAHDPIQRDIFTPLFLGAQLYVPTADDIGTPGRLAEWMAENQCSVTHLTPAMGQLLSAQAVAQIPSLMNAFFVGDILTKRDCLKLQALAHNTAIINMYGTTETQRAVSYFRVPSINEDPQFLTTQKDIIPAGKGMLNVQMLVVNRNSPEEICGVGEVGEIYVRAGGLSDGYLGLLDMTAKKFLTSWFVDPTHWKSTVPLQDGWLGPRDRLYRTGDLGRYLPDGNTEVSGRADDQVKIRGFRIELGEINTHLSKHPYVRENITLLRRNKDEDPVLVAYVVPESKSAADDMLSAHESLGEDNDADDVVTGLVTYQKLIKDIRAYLKTKLPSYAIPSVIVPMSRLPLNPNGKVDKPKLPFPDTAQMELASRHLRKKQKGNEEGEASWTDTERKVWDLWLSILPTKPPTVEVTDSFFDLGGHSILATKMIFEARSKLGIPDLPLGAVFSSPSIKEFAKAVDQLKGVDTILSGSEPKSSSADAASGETSPSASVTFGADADALAETLPSYVTASKQVTGPYTVFLTGATGFLGSYILKDLLERRDTKKVFVQVRAKDSEHALERVKSTGLAYGIWKDEYLDRIQFVTGSLEAPKMGLDEISWRQVTEETDVVIHNGALVHWVYPYSTLKGPNVIGTLNAMELCTQGKPKYFTFVSSTSVLDNQHYIDLSDALTEAGEAGVPEEDSLDGSRDNLGTGYGQSKWVSEYLLRLAGQKHGLRGTIVRPGYVVGDSKTGVSNTDDFLLRMLKGCQELQLFPSISNSVNMVPVDHVARVTVASALNAHILDSVSVAQVTSHPRITFDKFLGSLQDFGYTIQETEYVHWRVALEKFVVEKGDSALFPLLHFVLDNLPQDTKAPELDDRNTRALLKADMKHTGIDVSSGAGTDRATLESYVSFLVAIGFLDKPSTAGHLSNTKADKQVIANFSKAGGRSR